MFNIDLLRKEFEKYRHQVFFTHYDGVYCYKSDDNIIWGYEHGWIIIEEYNGLFTCSNVTNKWVIKSITKKKFFTFP